MKKFTNLTKNWSENSKFKISANQHDDRSLGRNLLMHPMATFNKNLTFFSRSKFLWRKTPMVTVWSSMGIGISFFYMNSCLVTTHLKQHVTLTKNEGEGTTSEHTKCAVGSKIFWKDTWASKIGGSRTFSSCWQRQMRALVEGNVNARQCPAARYANDTPEAQRITKLENITSSPYSPGLSQLIIIFQATQRLFTGK